VNDDLDVVWILGVKAACQSRVTRPWTGHHFLPPARTAETVLTRPKPETGGFRSDDEMIAHHGTTIRSRYARQTVAWHLKPSEFFVVENPIARGFIAVDGTSRRCPSIVTVDHEHWTEK